MTSAERDDWESHWNAYSDAASSNPAQHFRFRRIGALVTKMLENSPSRLVVDVGCGNGDFLEYIRKTARDIDILGIEPSQSGSSISAKKVGAGKIRRLDLVTSPSTETSA